ncbi:MAG TPA: S8 family serine peptidase [Frankiaceae bacterium]|jgi:subtilisin|nr:S8 family serine peptidase [Frankiaceae bacterium]
MTFFTLSHQARTPTDLDPLVAAAEAAGATVVADHTSSTRRIVRLEGADDLAERLAAPPGVILERDEPRGPMQAHPVGFRGASPATLSAPPAGDAPETFVLHVTGAGRPLASTGVLLYLQGAGGDQKMLPAETDASGTATFSFDPSVYDVAGAMAVPTDDYWTLHVPHPANRDTIDCPALPETSRLMWWHEAVGITTWDESLGAGISVGVVDTGVSPNAWLAHVVDGGSIVAGVHSADGTDVNGHGTHVCGVVAARPTGPGTGGIAPGASVTSIRVYPPPGLATSPADVASAIDALAEAGTDLVNLSLYSATQSSLETDAIANAWAAGTVCLAAAGNVSGPVLWPAATPEACAVAALGRAGWGPPHADVDDYVPTDPAWFGRDDLYLANFSAHGDGLACAMPGVGIVSTAPATATTTASSEQSGTSCATPVAVGVLAAALSKDATYLALPRGPERSARAKEVLASCCEAIGIPPALVGPGLAVVPAG